MKGILNYWKLLLLIAVWVSGWGFACISLVHAIKAYDVELSIQFFLRSLVIQLFLPTLLIAAIGIAFGLTVTMVWHPKWNIRKTVGQKTRHLATNIIKIRIRSMWETRPYFYYYDTIGRIQTEEFKV